MASRFKQIADAVCDAPEIDKNKVEAVRDALARGTYDVNPRQIAEKLLDADPALKGGRGR